jgi:hypothetical protein
MKFTFPKLKEKKDQAPKRFSWNPIHPRRDWQRLLIAFLVIAIGIGIWSGYLFFKSEQQSGVVSQSSTVEDNLVSQQIQRIEDFFKKRNEPSEPSL